MEVLVIFYRDWRNEDFFIEGVEKRNHTMTEEDQMKNFLLKKNGQVYSCNDYEIVTMED